MAVVLDSSVVIGFLDRDDALHEEAEIAIRKALASTQLLASAVTYAEVLAGAEIGHHAPDEVRGFFSDLVTRILPVDAAVAEPAAAIRAATSVLMPDALILATAHLEPDAEVLLTGDTAIAEIHNLSCEIRLLRPAR